MGVEDRERKVDFRASAILVSIFFSIFVAGEAITVLFVPGGYHWGGTVTTIILDMCVFSVYWVRRFSRTVDERILTTAGLSAIFPLILMMLLFLFSPWKSSLTGLPENLFVSYFLLIALPVSLAVVSLAFELASYHYGKLDKARIQQLGGLSEDFERRYPLGFNAKRPIGRLFLALVVTAYFLIVYNLMYVALYKLVQGADILVLSGLIASTFGVLIASRVSFVRSLLDSLDKGVRPPVKAGSAPDHH